MFGQVSDSEEGLAKYSDDGGGQQVTYMSKAQDGEDQASVSSISQYKLQKETICGRGKGLLAEGGLGLGRQLLDASRNLEAALQNMRDKLEKGVTSLQVQGSLMKLALQEVEYAKSIVRVQHADMQRKGTSNSGKVEEEDLNSFQMQSAGGEDRRLDLKALVEQQAEQKLLDKVGACFEMRSRKATSN
eukprot:jgi/Mesen1/1567/ME000134S00688